MDLRPHAGRLPQAGPLDVRIVGGPPGPLASFADRKQLARHSEDEVRANVVRVLRGRSSTETIATTRPAEPPPPVRMRRADAERSRMV